MSRLVQWSYVKCMRKARSSVVLYTMKLAAVWQFVAPWLYGAMSPSVLYSDNEAQVVPRLETFLADAKLFVPLSAI